MAVIGGLRAPRVVKRLFDVELPPRYAEPWGQPFRARLRPLLTSGLRILDVGSGCQPTLSPEERPAGTFYVGLDCSRAELEKAPPGSYDKIVVANVAELVPELENRFDLVISFQVFEHVKPLRAALTNVRSYLRPNGHLVAQFSGTYSAFGLLSAGLPQRSRVWAVHRFTGRSRESIFPAPYDHCYASALRKMLNSWSDRRIVPLYLGSWYFGFLPPIQRLYLAYEEWAHGHGHANLATHYVVVARR